MHKTSRSNEMVDLWRSEADSSNPAGPLFAGGQFAEADIVCETGTGSGQCGSVCTGSRQFHCC